jgi:hypothetical protein
VYFYQLGRLLVLLLAASVCPMFEILLSKRNLVKPFSSQFQSLPLMMWCELYGAQPSFGYVLQTVSCYVTNNHIWCPKLLQFCLRKRLRVVEIKMFSWKRHIYLRFLLLCCPINSSLAVVLGCIWPECSLWTQYYKGLLWSPKTTVFVAKNRVRTTHLVQDPANLHRNAGVTFLFGLF